MAANLTVVVQSVRSAWANLRCDIREYINYAEVGKAFWGEDCGPRWWLWIEGTYTILKWRWLAKWCKFAGHKWQDCGSYANGESAADSFYCVRCGKTIHHTYY